MINIIYVEMSKNTVKTNEQFIMRVKFPTQTYFSQFKHSQLEGFTHKQLAERGVFQ